MWNLNVKAQYFAILCNAALVCTSLPTLKPDHREYKDVIVTRVRIDIKVSDERHHSIYQRILGI